MKAIKFFVYLSLLACVSPAFANKNCPDRVVVHAIGDSITQGLMRTGGGVISGIVNPVFGADPNGSYSPSIKMKIGSILEEPASKCDDTLVRFKNWGVGGYRTNQLISLIPTVMSGVNPQETGVLHYFLVMGGANDLYEGLNPATTKSNLSKVLDRLRSFGVTEDQIVLANITENFLYPQINVSYNSQIAILATEESVFYVNMYGCMQPWNNLNSGDGLHVSTSGYTQMASCFLNAFEDNLRLKIKNSGNVIAPIFLLLLDEEAPVPE